MTLRELRTSKGLAPSYVADKLGISYRHFNRIENGEGYLTKERIKALAKLYKVTMTHITSIGGTENARDN